MVLTCLHTSNMLALKKAPPSTSLTRFFLEAKIHILYIQTPLQRNQSIYIEKKTLIFYPRWIAKNGMRPAKPIAVQSCETWEAESLEWVWFLVFHFPGFAKVCFLTKGILVFCVFFPFFFGFLCESYFWS